MLSGEELLAESLLLGLKLFELLLSFLADLQIALLDDELVPENRSWIF